jgi:hypothetical protein
MGQQQLLLIVLGVIIVGIAIVVGIQMFKSNSSAACTDALISDLNNIAAKAQQFYVKPTSMGGGGNVFTGYKLSTLDTANNPNGFITITSNDGATVRLTALGKRPGTLDGTNPVHVICDVKAVSIQDSVLN